MRLGVTPYQVLENSLPQQGLLVMRAGCGFLHLRETSEMRRHSFVLPVCRRNVETTENIHFNFSAIPSIG